MTNRIFWRGNAGVVDLGEGEGRAELWVEGGETVCDELYERIIYFWLKRKLIW